MQLFRTCNFRRQLAAKSKNFCNPSYSPSPTPSPLLSTSISKIVTLFELSGHLLILNLILILIIIVAKKWDPGNLVPSRFSGQIRKVEAEIRKVGKD